LIVGTNQQAQPKDWGPWNTYFAGSWADQKQYNQEWYLPGCCPSGPSGCGATAWAMFFGYWDGKGVCNLIGPCNVTTPLQNDDTVKDCIKTVFGYTGSLCPTWLWSQTPTLPWKMYLGAYWAPHRGEGISIKISSGVPYFSWGPRNLAKHSISVMHWPAIVGTGFYSHYPLAYGYAYREYHWAWITWKTEELWLVNNGWGACTEEDCDWKWVSASSCWYGTEGYCW
jgi:hypothetical protein